jgi:flagellar biosynthetic protein FliR
MRIVPVFAFAPPFSLVPMPAQFRVLFALGLSVALATGQPQHALAAGAGLGAMFAAGCSELGLGLVIALAFHLVFGALYFAGRTIDVQAGFGLAQLIDPGSHAQTPLIGTLFALAAGAMFFAVGGHIELLRFFGASLETIPLGAWSMPHSIEHIAAFLSIVSIFALGVAGSTILVLFLIDMSIAFLSRTMPQMNVLVLGFQVKTIVLLLVLPASFGAGGMLLVRMMTMTLHALPGLV